MLPYISSSKTKKDFENALLFQKLLQYKWGDWVLPCGVVSTLRKNKERKRVNNLVRPNLKKLDMEKPELSFRPSSFTFIM